MVLVAVGVHPVADAGIDDGLDHAVLEDAGPVRCLDLLPRWVSMATLSMPLLASRWESIRPAGTAPTIPTACLDCRGHYGSLVGDRPMLGDFLVHHVARVTDNQHHLDRRERGDSGKDVEPPRVTTVAG